MNINEIEIKVQGIIDKVNRKWWHLLPKNVSIDIEELRKYGQDENYFSEIEINFWRDGDIIDVIAVIIYLEGKLQFNISEFEEWLDKEFNDIKNK